MKMYKFVKGNPNKLEGKALIYVYNISGGENIDKKDGIMNPPYLGIFTASDGFSLIEIMDSWSPVPSFLKNHIIEQYKEQMNIISEQRKKIERYLDSVPDSISISGIPSGIPIEMEEIKKFMKEKLQHQHYGIENPLIFDEEPEIQRIKGDVIKVDDIQNVHYSELLSTISRSYIIAYYNQHEEKTRKKHTPRVKNFKDMTPEEFKKVFFGLMSELMHAQETGQDCEMIHTDLNELTRGTPLFGDVINICKISETAFDGKLKIMELYTNKILAVVDERYEDAYEIVRQIKEMSI
jgi:hypothetical protein